MNAVPMNLAQYWFAEPAVAVNSASPHENGETASPVQQQELDALVERVNAARSVY